MRWSRELHGRWMKDCYLCKGYIEEESRSSEEQRYLCVNPACMTRYRLYLLPPSPKRKRGVIACLITTPWRVLKDAMDAFLYEEMCATHCPVCDAVLAERKGGILRCPSEGCNVAAEFYFQKLPASLVVFLIIIRIAEPGFSTVLSKNLEPHRRN